MHRPSSRRAWHLVLAALVTAVAVVVGGSSPASAHASLLSSDPADGAVLESAPEAVTMQFSESVAVQSDGVRVLDADGERVDAGTTEASGVTITAPIEGTLPDGGYVVAWRAVSADGHPIRGAFAFSVGEAAAVSTDVADDAFAATADRTYEIAGAVLRGLTYLGVLGAAGATLMGSVLHRRGDPAVVGRVVAALASVGLVGLLAQLPVQASLVTGRGLGSIADDGVLDLVLSDGMGASVLIVGAGLIAILLTTNLRHEDATKVLRIGGGLVAPLGLVVTGHTRTMEPAAVGFASDAAHVLAGAVWFGGLGALVAIVRHRRSAGSVGWAAHAVARFSGYAAILVALVVVSGTAMAWIEIGGIDPLTSTTYGRLFLAKVALIAVVIAGAAWNRFRLVPALTPLVSSDATTVHHRGEAVAAGDAADAEHADEVGEASDTDDAAARGDRGPTWEVLGRVLRLEVGALVAVLAVTGVLVNVTPAEVAVDRGPATVSAPFGDGTLEVVVDPASPGRNDVHVYLLDESGGVDDRYEDATFELALPSQEIGPLEREPVRVGPGHFQVVGTDLDLAGEWELTVTVKPDRFTEIEGTVTFPVE